MKPPSDMSPTSSDYLERVGNLLSDIEDEERVSLLAELGDQLQELPETELSQRLGTPEEFAHEYLRSASLEVSRPDIQESQTNTVATVISALAVPLGLLVLFSFGGQLVLGPFVLAIEWVLARISPRPLRITWSVLAGVLVGEILYLVINQQGGASRADGFQAIGAIVLTAALVTLLYNRTTSKKT